jgi:outer membrane protein
MIFLSLSTRRARFAGGLAYLLIALAPVAHAQSTSRSLSLGDAARLAAQHSAAAEIGRLRADQAGARVRQRQADLLPSFTASAGKSGRTFSTATLGLNFSGPDGKPFFNPNGELLGPVNNIDVRGRLSQSIVDLAAIERVRGARASADAGASDAASAGEQAAATAAVTYVRAARAQAQLAARVADSSLAEDLLRIARDQLQAGVGIALDVTRAQSQLAAVRAQLIASRNERDRARLDLQRALSLPIDSTIVLADSLAGLPATEAVPTEADATTRALRARPDVRALDLQYDAAARQTSALRAERLPTLSAFGDQGQIAEPGKSWLPTYTWGIQVSVPVFDGFRREGRIEEEEAARREVDVRRRDLRQQVAADVRSALLDLGSAREQVDASRERVQLTEQELGQARDRFRAGVAGNADVITALLSLNGARTQLVDALASFQLARVSLARAQGAVTELR